MNLNVPPRPPESVAELSGYLASFTNYENQRSLPTSRKGLGPERTRDLLQRLQLPPLPVVQVAGSKGKGSTVVWLDRLLRAASRSVGAYLSPHVERINDRILLDGEPISDAALLDGLRVLHPHVVQQVRANPSNCPTFFDLWTALAMTCFARHGCDLGLLEVGLGGPLDSTSAIPHEVGVLTRIDLEHRQELGPTREAIAVEKSRIARLGRPFVILEHDTPWGRQAAEQATKQGAVVFPVPAEQPVPEGLTAPQRENLRTALTTMAAWGYATPSLDELEQLTESPIPARLERLAGPLPLLLDSAHTPMSLTAFREEFEVQRQGKPGSILLAFLAGKEWEEALSLFPRDDSIEWIVTTPNLKRREDPTKIAGLLESLSPRVTIDENVPSAVARLRAAATAGRFCAVTGSVHLAGQVRTLWRNSERT